MATRIRLLSEQVANQIAAGEVIERPSSVVKELVENALDAGATQIEIRTKAGGRSLIEVTDNGFGMSRDDALLCLERHATSKLRVSEDLHRLESYGFRGEALPSIASISRFALRTREPGAEAGTEIIVNGGKIITVRESGLAPGTQMEVRSLFFNLPARRKFLRTEATERSHVEHQVILAGLSRSDVGFLVQHDEEAPQRWPTGQDLARRIAGIFGENWLNSLVPVEFEQGDLRVHGFIGQPGVSRSNRNDQYLFVNRRPVESRTIHFALQEGYHNALMRGRYPVVVLFLELSPQGVDVNIHPAKREVRFHEEHQIRQFLVHAVAQTLRQSQAAPVRADSPEPLTAKIAEGPFLRKEMPAETMQGEWGEPEGYLIPQRGGIQSQPVFDVPPPQVASLSLGSRPTEHPRPAPFGLRYLGVIARLYLVAESPQGLVVIDQHAAHERVMFEKVLARLVSQAPTSQRLLLPVTVTFSPKEADFLLAQIESLQAIGLEISPFGPESFLVDGLPSLVQIPSKDLESFLRDLVADLQAEGGETRKARRLSEEIVAKKACRLAVKANDSLSPRECEVLLQDLAQCELPYTCPHGRPTMILFSQGELEKKFGRTG